MQSKEFSGNQRKHQYLNPSILLCKFGLIFMRLKQKKIQNGRFSKMAIFQNSQFSKKFRENFTDSSLGQQDCMMQRALIWLNVYGREAVRHKLKNCRKTQKIHFQPVLELMSDSLTTIYVEPDQCPLHHAILLTQGRTCEIFTKKF